MLSRERLDEKSHPNVPKQGQLQKKSRRGAGGRDKKART